ncbi:hypothetical protein CRM22_011347 [Opisthorchis felineus]|uniref:Core-2/I-Branching enzyme n=1 Tax=Opisthorchis felineus TaxID=147828 RepID=A0A4S2JMI3_OPIFE|nr:hypothetical protein CRM22_011347 [Opisthorchis felineus]
MYKSILIVVLVTIFSITGIYLRAAYGGKSGQPTNICSHFRTQLNPPQLYSSNLGNTYNCRQLAQMVENVPIWTSQEELDFPIAFAISAYASFERLARSVRLIYRKHNTYCIHVDRKATVEVKRRIKYLAECYGSQVILVPDELSVDVKWGYFSVLQPTLLCAELLLKQRKVDWRYLLNLNEKELPLRTNWELVRALKNLKGSNLVEGFNGTRFKDRLPLKRLTFEVGYTG